MSNARNLANLLSASGDVKEAHLDEADLAYCFVDMSNATALQPQVPILIEDTLEEHTLLDL
jgi:hypothetical protein